MSESKIEPRVSLTFRFEALCDKLGSIFAGRFFPLLLLILFSFYLFIGFSGADPDLFARLAVGRLIAELGYLPQQDPFAFSPKKPDWVDHEWLSGVIFFGLNEFGGDRALFLFKCLCAFLTFQCLLQARQIFCSKSEVSIGWILLCGLNCSYLWTSTVRAQVFTYLFLAMLLKLLLKFQSQGRLVDMIAMPLIFAAWTNLHGGFPLGMLLVAAFCLFSPKAVKPRLFILLTACLAATLVNPYPGLSLWRFIVEALSMPRPTISEWQSLNIFSPQAQIQNLVTVVIVSGWILGKERRCTLGGTLLFGSALAAYSAERLSALYMFSAIVFGSPLYEQSCARLAHGLPVLVRKIQRSLNFSLAALAVICSINCAKFLAAFPSFALDRSGYPQAALDWIWNNELQGRLLIDFNLGSYAIWRLYPRFLVSLDGRYEEVYPESTLRLVDAALNPRSPGNRAAISQLNPSHILLPATVSPSLFPAEWAEIYSDGRFRLLARKVS